MRQTGMCPTPKGRTENHITHLPFGMLSVLGLFSSLLETTSCQLLTWSVNWVLLKCNFQSSPALTFLQMSFVCIKYVLRLSRMSSYQWRQHLASPAACTGSCCYMPVVSTNRAVPTLKASWKRLGVRAVQWKKRERPKLVSAKAQGVKWLLFCTGDRMQFLTLTKTRVLHPGCYCATVSHCTQLKAQSPQ